MNGTFTKILGIFIPWVGCGLFVTQAQLTSFNVQFQYFNLQSIAYGNKLGWVLDFLGPRKVRNVDQTVDSFFQLYEYAEVGEIPYDSFVLGTYRVLGRDVGPWIWSQLLNAQRHFAVFPIQSQNNSLNLVTYVHEILSRSQVGRPGHFRNVDQTFNTISYFDKGTVISNNHYFTFNFVSYFDLIPKSIPWVFLQLLKTQLDPRFVIIEIKDYHVQFLVKFNNLVGVVDTAPRKVGNVDQTIHTSKVDKDSVRSDVFHNTFQYLAFLQLTDDLFFLFFDIRFDQSFVRYHYVLELVVDLHYFELHGLTYVLIVIADRFHVDLGTWQERLNSEYIYDHTTFGTTLNITLYNLFFVMGIVHTIPGLDGSGFSV